MTSRLLAFVILSSWIVPIDGAAIANSYRPKDVAVAVGRSNMIVTPRRDWNRLNIAPGKFAEVWTLDGEQLNEVTLYSGIEPGNPLIREKNKKREPLPKFDKQTLLIEIPEILEKTYRTYRNIANFNLTSSSPGPFLQKDGIQFSYSYTDQDQLPRKGVARAAVVNNRLYMMTYDAPRTHFFDKNVDDFRALADSATLKP